MLPGFLLYLIKGSLTFISVGSFVESSRRMGHACSLKIIILSGNIWRNYRQGVQRLPSNLGVSICERKRETLKKGKIWREVEDLLIMAKA